MQKNSSQSSASGILPMLARAAYVAAAAAVGLAAPTALGQAISTQLTASGLNHPTTMAYAPGDSTRLYVVEQRGVVKLIKNGLLQASPFLDIDSVVPEQTYSGMLGIAFHPNYANNGRFYVFHTTGFSSSITIWIKEFTRTVGDPDHANVASSRVIFRLTSPNNPAYHLGGAIAFGPDGKLWIPLGDGTNTGVAAGPQYSQSSTSLWGKLLRIDVDTDDFPADPNANYGIPADNPYATSPTVAHEIFLRGLRNPYRSSFDRITGKLWIGDVGATSREEIDVINPATDGGANLGWNCAEGFLCTSNANCTCGAGLKPPVYDYSFGSSRCVTGGVMYHGCALPALEGTYFFGDYQLSKLYSFQYNETTGAVSGFLDRTAQVTSPALSNPVAIVEDMLGELYIVEHTAGRIRKIVGNPLPLDTDHDGIPDSCEPPAGDLNGDYHVDGADLGILLAGWGTAGATDLNADGTTDGADLGVLLAGWTP